MRRVIIDRFIRRNDLDPAVRALALDIQQELLKAAQRAGSLHESRRFSTLHRAFDVVSDPVIERVPVDREVPHVHFIEDCVHVLLQRHETVRGPARRVGLPGIVDQRPAGIGGTIAGIGIIDAIDRRLVRSRPLVRNLEEVVLSILVSFELGRPDALESRDIGIETES